ncbi:nitroreductase [Candidatus Woesearchaeota archaeon CG08_land_8_20_14_0_20_47_9]|nr:MAG: nitroreductase [Candidatus Woesearchaeota archaeon CG08_land_8_20_14_0_20_47_9]
MNSEDIYNCIKTRRSIRKFDESRKVEWEKVCTILDAARYAPNAGNLQCWKFVVVRDKDARKNLATAAFRQYWMTDAPVFIVVCAVLKRLRDHYGERGVGLYAIQDCAAATENILIMSHALGLGACWVGAFDDDLVAQVVGAGGDVKPMAIIPIGYHFPHQPVKTPQRLMLENMVYFEKMYNRVGNLDFVLWNFRIGELAVEGAKEVAGETARQASKLPEKGKALIRALKSGIESFRAELKEEKK